MTSATPIKADAYLALKPGDPWTFIGSRSLEGSIIGSIIITGGDPVRQYRVTAVDGIAIETEYVGFAQIGGSR